LRTRMNWGLIVEAHSSLLSPPRDDTRSETLNAPTGGL
jgi:hypothetical protein